MRHRCDDESAPEGRRSHTWDRSGLDNIIDGNGRTVLANVRRCITCGRREWKAYGRRGGWNRLARKTVTS